MKLSTQNHSSALKQGSILAAATLITRIIGMFYKIPLTYIIGKAGMTYYNTAYEIYNIALILSSLSIPLAVSKLISAKDENKEYKFSGKIFRVSLVLASITGGTAGLIIVIFAKPLASFFKYPSAASALRILGPTIFIVAVLGVVRGLFQGKKNMIPTALSQVFEQIINAVVSILAALLFMKAGNTDNEKAALGASGGTLGTLCGAVSALLFMFFIYSLNKEYIKKNEEKDTTEVKTSNIKIFKIVFLTMLPIVFSQLVFQISGVIDTKIFSEYFAKHVGTDEKLRAVIYEAYVNKYKQLSNIPVAIATALSAAIVPTLSGLLQTNNMREIRSKIASGIKLNMIIAIPAAVGMGVLSNQIVYMLYKEDASALDYPGGGALLKLGCVAIIFFAFSTMTNGILQGIDRMRTPVINSLIALALHIVLLGYLLFGLDLGTYGLVIGNFTFALTVCILNWFSLKRYARYKQEIVKTFVCPAIASAIMGAIVWLSYTAVNVGLGAVMPGRVYVPNLIATMVSILIGIIVYFLMLGVLHTATYEELKEYPMGMRFAKIFIKLNLLSNDENNSDNSI